MVRFTTQTSELNMGHIMWSRYANLMKTKNAQEKLNRNISAKKEILFYLNSSKMNSDADIF